MKKTEKLFGIIALVISIYIYGCQAPVNNIKPTPTPSSSSGILVPPVQTNTPSPGPTSTPTPQNQYSYELPLKVFQVGECGLGNRTTHEITNDGTYTYLSDDFSKTEIKKLTEYQVTTFKTLLNDLNIALYAEKDVDLPPGSPQTKECRSVEFFTMIVNQQDRTFDRNARLKIHTPEYLETINKLKLSLDELKK
jgi:hypothetical protein